IADIDLERIEAAAPKRRKGNLTKPRPGIAHRARSIFAAQIRIACGARHVDWHGPRTKSREDIWRRRSAKRVGVPHSRGLVPSAPRRGPGDAAAGDPHDRPAAGPLPPGTRYNKTSPTAKNVARAPPAQAELPAAEPPTRGLTPRPPTGHPKNRQTPPSHSST